MTFKISATRLADASLIRQNNNQFGRNSSLAVNPDFVWIIFCIAIFAFNIVATCIALINIFTKGYDPYIHGSSMFISVLTLGCIAIIHKFIIER